MARQVDRVTANKWTARGVPIVLMGIVGYATYVHVVRLCVFYLLRGPIRRPSAAIALLVIYFILMFMMSLCYFRLLYVVTFDPGYVPLGPQAIERQKNGPRGFDTMPTPGRRRASVDFGGVEYNSAEMGTGSRLDLDSPGLENFYTKDVFICDSDGRPKWCGVCCNWKPDRTHHCSDAGRCVKKMDHFCPWVGGVVGENSFKFFIQFVSYTFVYCLFLLVVMAFFVHEQKTSQNPNVSLDVTFAVILGIAAFFGLFTGSMSGSSTQFALCNLTTVENIDKKRKVYQLAVIIPPSALAIFTTQSGIAPATITYPLERQSLARTEVSREDPSLDRYTLVVVSPSSSANSSPSQSSAERDAKAQRTFAILRMQPDQNPWDLGSFGNWKTVMGNGIFEWLFPIRRSPCTNHEAPASQFPMGRFVEELRAKNGLLQPEGVTSEKPRAARSARREKRRKETAMEMDVVAGGREKRAGGDRRREKRGRDEVGTDVQTGRGEMAVDKYGVPSHQGEVVR